MINIKSETIAHYLRMRAWVLTQPKKDQMNMELMKNEIHETSDGTYCPYCFHRNNMYGPSPYGIICDSCTLATPEMKNVRMCCDGAWRKLGNTKTWKEWLEAWEHIVYYICVFG